MNTPAITPDHAETLESVKESREGWLTALVERDCQKRELAYAAQLEAEAAAGNPTSAELLRQLVITASVTPDEFDAPDAVLPVTPAPKPILRKDQGVPKMEKRSVRRRGERLEIWAEAMEPMRLGSFEI